MRKWFEQFIGKRLSNSKGRSYIWWRWFATMFEKDIPVALVGFIYKYPKLGYHMTDVCVLGDICYILTDTPMLWMNKKTNQEEEFFEYVGVHLKVIDDGRMSNVSKIYSYISLLGSNEEDN